MTSITALEDLSHDPKLAEALGNMVIVWAHAEIMLFSTFSRVAGIGLNMAMESWHRIPTFESRVKFIVALIGEWKTDQFNAAEVAEAVTKLGKLARTRNHWVHGDWCADDDTKETIIFDHRAALDSPARSKTVKAHDVLDHCEAVKRRAKALGRIIKWTELRA